MAGQGRQRGLLCTRQVRRLGGDEPRHKLEFSGVLIRKEGTTPWPLTCALLVFPRPRHDTGAKHPGRSSGPIVVRRRDSIERLAKVQGRVLSLA
jgi:hypothetical protein